MSFLDWMKEYDPAISLEMFEELKDLILKWSSNLRKAGVSVVPGVAMIIGVLSSHAKVVSEALERASKGELEL